MSNLASAKPCVQYLFKWIEDNLIQLRNSSGFLPADLLNEHLRKDDLSVPEAILAEFVPRGSATAYAKRIVDYEYVQVFCILLEIDKICFLDWFLNHDNLKDTHLPFIDKPADFPLQPNDPEFYAKFCERQWKFCPRRLSYLQEGDLNDNHILPFKEKESIGTGASSEVYKVEVVPFYNDLTRAHTNHIDTDTFALKIFKGRNAGKVWKRELESFRIIQRAAPTKSIIGFHYAFKRKNSFGIILEYADKGSLEQYLEVETPPTEERDIVAFLEGLLGLLSGLKELHDGDQCIWHQDIKPANVLVLSGDKKASKYACRFKLGDLSTSHWKHIDPTDADNTDRDSQGTRTYGAPDCHRVDSPLGEGVIRVHSHVDHWSLGCVFSEVLVWLILGMDGILEYRSNRRDYIQSLPGRDAGDYFHDGTTVLPVVSEWLAKVKNHHAETTILTEIVDLIEMMLGPFRNNNTALTYCTKAHHIVRAAKERLPRPSQEDPTERPETPPMFDFFNTKPVVSPASPISPTSPPSRMSSVLGSTPERRSRPSTKQPVSFPSILNQESHKVPEPPKLPLDAARRWYQNQKNPIRGKSPLPNSNELKVLQNRDMIFIIDDSETMRRHWPAVEDLFKLLAYILKLEDDDGLDLYFTSSFEKHHHKHTTPLRDRIHRQMTERNKGHSDMSRTLEHVLGDYTLAVERQPRGTKRRKGLNVYIFTDGIWNPSCDIVPAIDNCVKSMMRHRVPEKEVGLQFISFGNDTEGLNRLRLVDNYLELRLDIVDTEPSTGDVLKMLCGACHRWFDDTPDDLGTETEMRE